MIATGRRLRLVGAIARMVLAVLVEYRAQAYIWMLAGALPLLMMVVWRHIAESEAIGGFDRVGFARYFLIVFLVTQLVQCWVIWNFDEKIRSGTLAVGLLRPFDPFLGEVVENVTTNLFRSPLWLPIVAAGLWATGAHADIQWASLPVFLVALAGAWAIQFNLHYGLALAGFWTERMRAFDAWAYLMLGAFGGGLFPLELLPPELRSLVELTPFPYIIGFPASILAQGLPAGEIMRGLALQIVWIAILVVVHRLLWRQGIRRFGAVGG